MKDFTARFTFKTPIPYYLVVSVAPMDSYIIKPNATDTTMILKVVINRDNYIQYGYNTLPAYQFLTAADTIYLSKTPALTKQTFIVDPSKFKIQP